MTVLHNIDPKDTPDSTDKILGSDSDGLAWNFNIEVLKEYFLTNVNYIKYDIEAAPSQPEEGEVNWNSDAGVLQFGLPGGNVVLQMGQELLLKVYNNSGSQIDNGTAIYVNGVQGNRPTISLARSDSYATAITFIGLTTENIPNNSNGYVCVNGLVRGFDTSSFSEGDILYISSTVAGGFTTTPPVAPNFVIGIGIVLRSNAEEGIVAVHPRIYPDLNRIADVSISSLSSSLNQILLYDFVNGYWYNSNPIFGNTSTSNYSEFEADGTLVFNGDATVWKDIQLSATALGTGASAPDLVELNSSGIFTRAFGGGATTEQLFGSFEIPHDYKEGSDLSPHIHWLTTTTGAGDVKWNVDFYRTAVGGIFSSTPNTISTTESTNETAWENFISITETISGTGIVIGEQVGFRLYRNPTDAEDTYAGDAAVLTFGIHYQADTVGSRQIATKN